MPIRTEFTAGERMCKATLEMTFNNIIKNAHIFYYITNSAPLQHVAAKKARFPENLYMYIQIIADRGKMI